MKLHYRLYGSRGKLLAPSFDIWSVVRTVVTSIAGYALVLKGLATLVPHYSANEIATRLASTDLSSLVTHPVSAPYHALNWLATRFLHNDLLASRRLSACLGLTALFLFWYVVSRYYDRRTSTLATLLFACSGGFLYAARLGTPMVLQFSALALLALALYMRQAKHLTASTYGAAASIAVMLYIPGLIWLILLGCILHYKTAHRLLSRMSTGHRIGVGATILVLCTPLLWGIGHDIAIVKSLAGLPAVLPGVAALPKEFAHFWLALGFRSYYSPEIALQGAALLSVTELALLLLGLYELVRSARRKVGYYIVLAIIIVSVLTSLGGTVTYTMAMPLIYFVIAAGIHYLIREWLAMFPRNPVARVVGTLLVSLLIGFSVLYQLRSYFVAWPHHQPTRTTFTHTHL
jgi:hypothetical protein